MGLLIFLQVIFDLAFIATATLLLIERSKVRSTEDPKLSRGLQLLSSKIAILQDLMDRSDTMTRQMTTLMDGKQQDLQESLEDAAIHLLKIKQATEKSEKVAKIFQDQIPHQEIIEQKNTAKYQEAAKLAHQGLSLEDIAKRIDLPRGELELIVKVNRNRIVTETTEEPILPLATQTDSKEAHIRPFVFRKIIKHKDLITELDLQK
jgi:hypothetical protein